MESINLNIAVVSDDLITPEIFTIKAHKIGASQLAVHKHHLDPDDNKYWIISHIQTGFRIMDSFSKRKDAVKAADKLTLNDNWHIEGAEFGKVESLPQGRIDELGKIRQSVNI